MIGNILRRGFVGLWLILKVARIGYLSVKNKYRDIVGNKFAYEVEENSEYKKKQPVTEEKSTNLERTKQNDLVIEEVGHKKGAIEMQM